MPEVHKMQQVRKQTPAPSSTLTPQQERIVQPAPVVTTPTPSKAEQLTRQLPSIVSVLQSRTTTPVSENYALLQQFQQPYQLDQKIPNQLQTVNPFLDPPPATNIPVPQLAHSNGPIWRVYSDDPTRNMGMSETPMPPTNSTMLNSHNQQLSTISQVNSWQKTLPQTALAQDPITKLPSLKDRIQQQS